MPTIPPSGAFLSLLNPSNWKPYNASSEGTSSDSESDTSEPSECPSTKDHGPFSWAPWQARTGFMRPILSQSPHAGAPHQWQSKEDNDAVWSFVTKFWTLSQTERVNYIRRSRVDNDSRGRILYLDWFKAESPKWAFNRVILSSLSECGVDPYSTLKQLDGSTKVIGLTSPSSIPS